MSSGKFRFLVLMAVGLLVLGGVAFYVASAAEQAQTSGPTPINADRVDGFDAYDMPIAEALLALNGDAQYPLSTIPQGAGSGMDADTVDGFEAGAFAQLGHDHDARYFTQGQLSTAGQSQIDWGNLSSVPVDLADGDDDTTYTAGEGLSLLGNRFGLDFGGTGSASTVARSDHMHTPNLSQFTEWVAPDWEEYIGPDPDKTPRTYTELAIANPGPIAAGVTVTLYETTGDVACQFSVYLPPNWTTAGYLPNYNCSFSQGRHAGLARISSNTSQPILASGRVKAYLNGGERDFREIHFLPMPVE